MKKKSNPLYSKMALPSMVEIGLVILESMVFFTFTEGPSVNVKKTYSPRWKIGGQNSSLPNAFSSGELK